jgi:hypothetical protein
LLGGGDSIAIEVHGLAGLKALVSGGTERFKEFEE